MNWGSWLLWGFVGTAVLTSVMADTQALGTTRMSLPYLLGTMFTSNRDRAKIIGILVHFVNGWLFPLIYVASMYGWNSSTVLVSLRAVHRWCWPPPRRAQGQKTRTHRFP